MLSLKPRSLLGPSRLLYRTLGSDASLWSTARCLTSRLYSSTQVDQRSPDRVPDFVAYQKQTRHDHGRLINTNWTTLEDQPLTGKSVNDLINNAIPIIRHRGFLSADKCKELVQIVQEHQMGLYSHQVVFPHIGTIGVTQYEYSQDKETYLNRVDEAYSLQKRFKEEANIDILARVAALLQEATGLETRVAREGGRSYFAGLLRTVNEGLQVHVDYAPHRGEGWEVSKIATQLTWNILLKQVPGGDTIIYDRQYQGAADEQAFRKGFPQYAYEPGVVQGAICKPMKAIEGDLTFFNSRNFHEVKPCDKTPDQSEDVVRYTMTSFLGYLPGQSKGAPPSLILWS